MTVEVLYPDGGVTTVENVLRVTVEGLYLSVRLSGGSWGFPLSGLRRWRVTHA